MTQAVESPKTRFWQEHYRLEFAFRCAVQNQAMRGMPEHFTAFPAVARQIQAPSSIILEAVQILDDSLAENDEAIAAILRKWQRRAEEGGVMWGMDMFGG